MQSSPFEIDRRGPDPLDPGPGGFAHRGLHGPGVRENSLAAFEAAIRQGVGIELDVLFTSDDIPIVLHDRKLSRFGAVGEDDPRAPLYVRECARILPDGYPIASTLADALALIDGRVPVLVEVKASLKGISYPGKRAKQTSDVVRGYRGAVGIMSFHPYVPFWLRRRTPDLRRGLVLPDGLCALERWWRLQWARPHFLAVEVSAFERPWVARLRQRMPVYAWTVKSRDYRQALEPLADALIWEGDGRG